MNKQPRPLWICSTGKIVNDIVSIVKSKNNYLLAGILTSPELSKFLDIGCVVTTEMSWKSLVGTTGSKNAFLLVCGFPHKIPQTVLNRFEWGGYNVHPSFLPEYRGRYPVEWIWVNQHPWASVTIHEMTETFDAGPIVIQERVAMKKPYSLTLLRERTKEMTLSLINDFLILSSEGRPSSFSQANDMAFTVHGLPPKSKEL